MELAWLWTPPSPLAGLTLACGWDLPNAASALCFVGLMLCVAFTLVWGVAWRMRNAGIVDVFWGISAILGTGLLLGIGSAPLAVKALMGLPLTIGYGRLSIYLWYRFWQHAQIEDPRYTAFRAISKHPALQELAMWGLFLLQALLMTVFLLPVALVANVTPLIPPNALLSHWPWLAGSLGLWAVGFTLETLADAQLAAFRKHPVPHPDYPTEKPLLTTGVWGLSRHPNYLGQWLMALSYSLLALTFARTDFDVWLCLLPAVLLYGILTRGTGIAATEAHLATTRPQAFAAYCKKTAAFFPGIHLY